MNTKKTLIIGAVVLAVGAIGVIANNTVNKAGELAKGNDAITKVDKFAKNDAIHRIDKFAMGSDAIRQEILAKNDAIRQDIFIKKEALKQDILVKNDAIYKIDKYTIEQGEMHVLCPECESTHIISAEIVAMANDAIRSHSLPNSSISIACDECGATLTIPAETLADANDAINRLQRA